MSIRIEHRVPAFITGPSTFLASHLITKKQREGEESQAQYQHDQSRYDRQSSALGEAISKPFDAMSAKAMMGTKNAMALASAKELAQVRNAGAMDRYAYRDTGYSRADLQGIGNRVFADNPQYEGPMKMSLNDAAARYGASPEGFTENLGRQYVQAQQVQAALVQQQEVWAEKRKAAAQDEVWDSSAWAPKQIQQIAANRRERAAVLANDSIAPQDQQAVVTELDRAYRSFTPAGTQRTQPPPFSTPTAIPNTNKVGFIDPTGKFHTFDGAKQYPSGQGAGEQWHDSSGVYYRDEKGKINTRESFSPDFTILSKSASQIREDARNASVDGEYTMTQEESMQAAMSQHQAYVGMRREALEGDRQRVQAEAQQAQQQQKMMQYKQAKQFLQQAQQSGPVDPQSDQGKQVQQAQQFVQQFEAQFAEQVAQQQQAQGQSPDAPQQGPQQQRPSYQQIQSQDPTALSGDFGVLPTPDGGFATEMSATVRIPEMFGKRYVNIPLLVKGQSQANIRKLLTGEGPPTKAQVDVAKKRAMEKVEEGRRLPSYATKDEAVKAAKARSREQEKMVKKFTQQSQQQPQQGAARQQPDIPTKDVEAAKAEVLKMMRKYKHGSEMPPEVAARFKQLLQITMSQMKPDEG